MNRLKVVGYTIISIFVVIAIIGPFMLSNSPFAFPYPSFAPPSHQNWLGTNHLGQDIWTQLIYGTRTTLFIGFSVALISTFLSVTLGLLAGYSKRLDPYINGVGNMLIIIPSLLLIIVITSFTQGSLLQMIIVLGCLTWAPYMRIIRATTLSLKEREFVKAAYLFGGKTSYILRKHLLPHIIPIMKTKFIVTFRTAILTEAGLAFLGLGDPNVISWGKMIQFAFYENAVFLTNAWLWVLLPPIILLIILTIAVVLISEEETVIKQKIKSDRKREMIVLVKPDLDVALSCKHVSVTLGNKQILNDVTFSIGRGKIVSLIGKSGSGKTTLGRTIYGLLSPEEASGEIYVTGNRLWKDIAFMMQDPRTALHPLFTIEQQFYEVLDQNVSKEEKQSIIKKALEEVQLPDVVMKKYPHELSGGMLNRVMIALAFLHKPTLIIADEVTSGLDPLLKKMVVDVLKRKAKEENTALLFITHDHDIAHYFSDEVIRMENGTLHDVDMEGVACSK